PGGIAEFDDEVPALDMAQVAQPLEEGLSAAGFFGRHVELQEADASNLRPLLPLGDEGSDEEAETENSRERGAQQRHVATAMYRPRSASESGDATGDEAARLNRAGALEGGDLVLAIAELAEDLVRVLAALGRGRSHGRRCPLEVHAVPDQPDRAEGLAHHRP